MSEAIAQKLDDVADADRLRADLASVVDNPGLVGARCEACLAPLLDTDDYVVDDNGCCGCIPAMSGDNPATGPCYAYRSLDRTIADALRARSEAADLGRAIG